jgi:hypothetical protein
MYIREIDNASRLKGGLRLELGRTRQLIQL